MGRLIPTRRVKAEDGSADQVIAAAGRLEIGESDLFLLAYRRWFGRDPEEQVLEQRFAAYMFRGVVPLWVRHYARDVLAPHRIGRAEARRLGLDRLPGTPPAPRHGRLVVAATGAVFLCLFVLLLDTGYDPRTSAPLTDAPNSAGVWRPSCAGGGPGLAFVEELAYAFAGKTPPQC